MALAVFGAVLGIGTPGSSEALRLIEAALPATRFLGSAALTAAVTTLALVMTLLGVSLSSDFEFTDLHYSRMRGIAAISVVTIVVSTLLLVMVTIPLQEVQGLRTWYSVFYYVLAGMIGLLGGLVVTTGLLIGSTIRGLIGVGRRGYGSELLVGTPDEEP
jgi:hypothetical protein